MPGFSILYLKPFQLRDLSRCLTKKIGFALHTYQTVAWVYDTMHKEGFQLKKKPRQKNENNTKQNIRGLRILHHSGKSPYNGKKLKTI